MSKHAKNASSKINSIIFEMWANAPDYYEELWIKIVG
jgi:hypothetical protein